MRPIRFPSKFDWPCGVGVWHDARMHTIAQIRADTVAEGLDAELSAQVASATARQTKDGKPFLELVMGDATGQITLRAWSDHPDYAMLSSLPAGGFLWIDGRFQLHPSFGVEARQWRARICTDQEIEDLLAGPPGLRERQSADFAFITDAVARTADPRLRALAELFLEKFGDRMRRTAAARNYHHARRGGLVEHAAQMMRAAEALCCVYPDLHRDLLVAGALFHDCGKLWENSMPERGFVMAYQETGELLGHIVTGVELVNRLWHTLLDEPAAAAWESFEPANDDVRMHLLHLIAAHHGEMEFGSPVVPKTPEAIALHYIDNLDAKLEMFRAGYQEARLLAPRIQERVRPLTGNLVRPLAVLVPEASAPAPETPTAQ